MTVFIDTAVIMYAAGAPHPHRQSCRAVLQHTADGRLDATTSTEVVQEILHRFSRGRRDTGAQMAEGVFRLFGRLLAIDHPTIVNTVLRFRRDTSISARDAVHVATCVRYGLDTIVSVDTGFDLVPGITRRAPEEFVDLSG